MIVLDSTLEIAFKEYLVNDSGTAYSNSRLLSIFGNRTQVHNEIKKHVDLGDTVWKKIVYYYNLRSKMVHEKVTVGIPDPEIDDFRKVVEAVLRKLFGLKF